VEIVPQILGSPFRPPLRPLLIDQRDETLLMKKPVPATDSGCASAEPALECRYTI
jgi:hypothetical protein